MSSRQYLSGTVSPVHITKRGMALLAVIAFFSVASLLRIGGISVAFAVALLFVAFFVYMRYLSSIRASIASRLVVNRRIEGELIEGRPVKVKIEIRNPTPVSLEHIEVYDSPPSLWDVDGQPSLAFFIPSYGRVTLSYTVKPVFGKHSFGSLKLVVYDPLGLFRSELTVGKPLEVRVLPRSLGEIRGVGLVPSSPRPGGTTPSRQKGVGTIFYDLREYVPGDDTRLIDWKALARTRRLLVKEFEQEVQVFTLLVFDVTPTMFVGIRGETKFENVARVLRTVIEYVAQRGDVYRLVIITPQNRVYASAWLRGRTSTYYALNMLSSLEWMQGGVGSDADTDISIRAGFLRNLYKYTGRERALIFLFTDVGESAYVARSYAEELRKLREMRNDVYVMIPLTAYFEAKHLLERDPTAAKLYTLLSRPTLYNYIGIKREFLRNGIPVVITGPVRMANVILQKLEAYRKMMA